MKPAPFRYVAARTIDQALQVKAEHGEEARFLAGGQSLVPTMNFRLTQPALLIDINPLSDCAGIRNSRSPDDAQRNSGISIPDYGVARRHPGFIQVPECLRIGALTRYRALERDPSTAARLPLIAEALPHIAHPQIRNRGTIGGNLAHADPASEMPAIMLALGGRLRAQSVRGERWIAAADFFVGALTTALAADEMLMEVELPVAPPRCGTCFMEMSRRRGDFAIIGVACTVRIDAEGCCTEARLALCNAGDGPVFAAEASASLAGRQIRQPEIDAAADLVQRAIDPGGSIHASKEFQRHLAGVLTKRALATATQRAVA